MSWTPQDIIAGCGASYTGGDLAIHGFAIDSRLVEPGFVYIALLGETTDGHLYVEEAFRKGAVAAIVMGGEFSGPVFRVADTFDALKRLGAYQRQRLTATKIIAVTGSCGKTTTKEMLRALLGQYGKTHASFRSYNTIYGVPIALMNCPLDAQYGVFEVGMNHAGEIREITGLLKPDLAMIMSVGAAHMGFFKDVQGIALAKAEIAEGLGPHGIMVVKQDSDSLATLQKALHHHHVLWFGENALDAGVLLSYNAGRVTAKIGTKEVFFSMGIQGKHFAMNAVGALLVLDALGLPLDPALAALKDFSGVAGRGSLHEIPFKGGSLRLMDESYNANPLSVKAALSRMSEYKIPGRKVFVFGGMGELGVHADLCHAGLLDAILQNGVDAVFVVGDFPKALWDILPETLRQGKAANPASLIPVLEDFLAPGDLLMVKGSLSIGMGSIVTALLKGDM